jgi:hypothetical protein
MTRKEARALLAQYHVTQTLHRDELMEVLAAWNSGPTPPRARYLFAELLDIEGKVEQLMGQIAKDGDQPTELP